MRNSVKKQKIRLDKTGKIFLVLYLLPIFAIFIGEFVMISIEFDIVTALGSMFGVFVVANLIYLPFTLTYYGFTSIANFILNKVKKIRISNLYGIFSIIGTIVSITSTILLIKSEYNDVTMDICYIVSLCVSVFIFISCCNNFTSSIKID